MLRRSRHSICEGGPCSFEGDDHALGDQSGMQWRRPVVRPQSVHQQPASSVDGATTRRPPRSVHITTTSSSRAVHDIQCATRGGKGAVFCRVRCQFMNNEG
jgi:hypothetical protein